MNIRIRDFLAYGLIMFTLPFLLGAVIHGAGGGGSAQGLQENFNLVNTITGVSENKPMNFFGEGAQNTSGVRIYQSTGGVTTITCVVSGVENDCDKIVTLNAGKKWQVKNSGNTVIVEVNETTGKFSAMTVDGEDAGISITLLKFLCGGDLVGVDPATGSAFHIWNKDPLSTAPTATAVVGTNQTYGVARFPDSATDHGVSIVCPLLAGHTGAVDAVVWAKGAGTGNWRLQLASKCYASDEANDAANNTSSKFTLPAGTSGRLNRYAVSAVDMTGCAANELAFLRAFRNNGEASDTYSAANFDIARIDVYGRYTY